mgnify:CR=1 FL=1
MSKPAPNSISGAIVPLTVTLPALLVDAGNHFQQCRLAAAVQADEAVEIAGHNIKRYIVQCEELVKTHTAVQQCDKYSFRLSCFSLERLKRIETWSMEMMGFCSAISMPPYMYRTNLS